ncbi:NAD(P)-dependent oxidoreductase [Polynucleobacter sinensis]|uniref:NAD(P)-dependent oxidoreductase n=1 Tax=Polynucleobacter sinensis TaxID=1743157 RepID=UPI0009EDC827|nr:NAD(P)-dependent oxidoreductase [Polynucleobacter sinensis]
MMKIGLIGTGRLGGGIVERLINVGHDVFIWNRSPEKTLHLVELGATLMASPAQVVEAAEIILSVLTDAQAIEAAYSGPNGVLSASLRGKVCIEMSTVRPETQIALAAKVISAGGEFVECPVGGSVMPAKEGALLGLVGGEASSVEQVLPLLRQMCRRVEHVGAVGSGSSLKLAINLPLLVYWESLSEAIALAEPIGIDPERLLDILADTSGAPNVMKARAPKIAAALKSGKPGATFFNIDSIRKDLQTMIEEGKSLGYSLPVAQAALSSFDRSSAAGYGASDGSELVTSWLAIAKK